MSKLHPTLLSFYLFLQSLTPVSRPKACPQTLEFLLPSHIKSCPTIFKIFLRPSSSLLFLTVWGISLAYFFYGFQGLSFYDLPFLLLYNYMIGCSSCIICVHSLFTYLFLYTYLFLLCCFLWTFPWCLSSELCWAKLMVMLFASLGLHVRSTSVL